MQQNRGFIIDKRLLKILFAEMYNFLWIDKIVVLWQLSVLALVFEETIGAEIALTQATIEISARRLFQIADVVVYVSLLFLFIVIEIF